MLISCSPTHVTWWGKKIYKASILLLRYSLIQKEFSVETLQSYRSLRSLSQIMPVSMERVIVKEWRQKVIASQFVLRLSKFTRLPVSAGLSDNKHSVFTYPSSNTYNISALMSHHCYLLLQYTNCNAAFLVTLIRIYNQNWHLGVPGKQLGNKQYFIFKSSLLRGTIDNLIFGDSNQVKDITTYNDSSYHYHTTWSSTAWAAKI